MAKKIKNPLPQDVQEAAEKVFLAGVGALSVAEEEGSKLFKELVKKGKKYDGAARREVEQIRKQVEGQVAQTREQVEERVEKVRKNVDAQTDKVRQSVDAQFGKVRKVADEALGGVEQRVQEAIIAALQNLGIPTRDEIAALRQSVQQLSKKLDATKPNQPVASDTTFAVEAVKGGGGWYTITLDGVAVDKVQGQEAADARVAELEAQR